MSDNLPRFMGRTPDFVSHVTGARRLNNSVMGNPRYDVAFANGRTCMTSSDSSAAYDVENARGRRGSVPAVAVWLTRAGRIEAMTILPADVEPPIWDRNAV